MPSLKEEWQCMSTWICVKFDSSQGEFSDCSACLGIVLCHQIDKRFCLTMNPVTIIALFFHMSVSTHNKLQEELHPDCCAHYGGPDIVA